METFLSAHWKDIVAALWIVDQGLKLAGKLFPQYPIIDNLADGLGNLLTKFFPKGQQ